MLKGRSESHPEVTTICSDFKERAWWESRVQAHSDAMHFCQQTGEAEQELGCRGISCSNLTHEFCDQSLC